jgi:hypothetical protein
MKNYKITYTKRVIKEIEADNFKDAAYRSALEMPHGYFISNIEEKNEIQERQKKVSVLFNELAEMFNPKKL